MIKHKLLLDLYEYRQKPTDEFRLTADLPLNSVEVTAKDLAIAICRGQTFTPAYLTKKGNDFWVSQGVIALDFDNKDREGNQIDNSLSPEKVLGLLRQAELDCSFIYETFSSTDEWKRFRVVIFLSEAVKDPDEILRIISLFKLLFPDVDRQATSLSQMYYGGKKILYENYNYTIAPNDLMIRIFSSCASSMENVTRDLKRKEEKVKKEWKENRNIHNIYNGTFDFYSKVDREKRILKKIDLGALSKKIKVLQDLVDGKWLTYGDYLGLASNLMYLEGGIQLYKKSLGKMVEMHHKTPAYHDALKEKPNFLNKLLNLPTVLKRYDYHPQNLKNFSPYEEDWRYKNLLSAVSKKGVFRVEEYATIPLASAREKFNEKLQEVTSSEDTKVHVFKVATGIGKTTACSKLENVVIGTRNHELKNDLRKKIKTGVYITPELPLKAMPASLARLVNYLYSVGAHTDAFALIAQEAKINKHVEAYLRTLRRAYSAEETVITTHQKALFIDWLHKTIIFDEDPIHSLLSIGNITANDLINLKGKIENEYDKQGLQSYIDSLSTGIKCCAIPTKNIGFRDFNALTSVVVQNEYLFGGDILGFLDSDYYVVDSDKSANVYFIRKHELPPDKKIIIFSATADEAIYKHLLGDRLRFYDISNVEKKGAIIMDNKYTCSRDKLSNDVECQDYLKKETSESHSVITYKGLKHLFPNSHPDLHLGNEMGSNALEGKDISVVGKYEQPLPVYLLYATALGIDFKPSDFHRTNRWISRKGIEFEIFTFAHQGLQDLHMFFLESVTRQSMGRSRFHEHPVLVKVFSDVMLPEADITPEEKEQSLRRIDLLKQDARVDDGEMIDPEADYLLEIISTSSQQFAVVM